jgi:hypothetical protein
MTRWAMAKTTDPAPSRSEVNDAIFSTLRGGLRILGGMAQMAAGLTKLLLETANKAVDAAEGAVRAKGNDEEEPKP